MIAEPPAQYLPYDGPLAILRPINPDAVCRALGLRGPRVDACTIWGEGACVIIIPRNAAPVLERHERAHCNGWGH